MNVRSSKGKNDTKHLCPLQLDVIERLVRLFTNEGELVFSPFAGVGSEGYVAIQHTRKFYGCEIKREYFDTAVKNLDRAVAQLKRTRFF